MRSITRLSRLCTAVVMAVCAVIPCAALASDPTPDPAEPPFIGTAPAPNTLPLVPGQSG